MYACDTSKKKKTTLWCVAHLRSRCTSCHGCFMTTTGIFTATWSSRRSGPAYMPHPGSSPSSPRTFPSALWPEFLVSFIFLHLLLCHVTVLTLDGKKDDRAFTVITTPKVTPLSRSRTQNDERKFC